MNPKSLIVSKRGYIVLPAHIRKELNIKPGSRVLIHRENDRLILESVQSFTQKLKGLTQHTIGDTPQEVNAFIDSERKARTDD